MTKPIYLDYNATTPIAPEVVKKIVQTFQCDYIQTYGMTETSP